MFNRSDLYFKINFYIKRIISLQINAGFFTIHEIHHIRIDTFEHFESIKNFKDSKKNNLVL